MQEEQKTEESKTTDQSETASCLGCGCFVIFLIIVFFMISSFFHQAPITTILPPQPDHPGLQDSNPTENNNNKNEKAKKVEQSNTWEIKIVDVEYPGKNLKWSDYGKIEEASGTWLVVNISLKNIGNQSYSLHPSNFSVIDSQGKKYNHYQDYTVTETYELYRGGKKIVNVILNPEVKVNLYLVFDVSPNATELKLDFKADVFAKSQVIELESSK